MKRFFSDDHEEDEDDIQNTSFSKDDLVHLMGIDIIEAKMNLDLLTQAIHIAETGTWFWKWRSLTFQLTRIQTIYLVLVSIMSPSIIETIEDELDDLAEDEEDDDDDDTSEGVDDAEL